MKSRDSVLECATCRRKLNEGDDALQLEEAILGSHGVVPLDKPILFCSEQCLKDFFNGSKGRLKMARRVP